MAASIALSLVLFAFTASASRPLTGEQPPWMRDLDPRATREPAPFPATCLRPDAPAIGCAGTADGWVPTSSAGGCAAVCAGGSALSFREFKGDVAQDTMLCAAQTAGSWALGYEQAGQGCVANVNGELTTSADYFCHCNTKEQLQGLALPAAAADSCVPACQAGFEGRSGVAVSKGGSGDACMPQSLIGNDNHFGTLRGGACQAVDNGVPIASTSFSCVCLFTSANVATLATEVGGR